jgi:hypothetical protein
MACSGFFSGSAISIGYSFFAHEASMMVITKSSHPNRAISLFPLFLPRDGFNERIEQPDLE